MQDLFAAVRRPKFSATNSVPNLVPGTFIAMNHPSNAESQHYYAEFQPWVPIFRQNVRYFSYYLWGAAGPWETAVAELRKRNLITSR